MCPLRVCILRLISSIVAKRLSLLPRTHANTYSLLLIQSTSSKLGYSTSRSQTLPVNLTQSSSYPVNLIQWTSPSQPTSTYTNQTNEQKQTRINYNRTEDGRPLYPIPLSLPLGSNGPFTHTQGRKQSWNETQQQNLSSLKQVLQAFHQRK